MSNPVLLTIDDDADVLRAIERDLRRQYGDRYRVLRADSAMAALETLRQLKLRNDAVALLLADQRMPKLDGVGFLRQAMELYPDAKRALLTAYADTDAAIRAINEVHIHHFLLKPWDPPEEQLYPVVDDLLDDWLSGFKPPFDGIRVLGSRWSPRSHEVREFLARNQIPYQWTDVESPDPELQPLLASFGEESHNLPLGLLPDGARLGAPSNTEIAARIGLRMRAEMPFYDLAIVGGGPAGLAAGVYGASEGLKTIIVEREAPGGQAGLSSRIENYLGFPSGLSGSDLARRAVIQARRFGAEIISPEEAIGVQAEGPYRIITLSDKTQLSCHALIIATGVQWRKLGVPGMDRLTGAGVYYGAGSTEAESCRGEDVYIIGGANSAGQAAMNFSRCAKRVIILVRGESLAATMSKYLIDDIEKTPNITVETASEVVEVHGKDHLESISIFCKRTGSVQTVPASSLFVFIGAEPRTEWLDGFVQRDKRGFIVTGPDLIRDGTPPSSWTLDRDPALLETSQPGVFAVGDVRHGSVKRVASSVGEGSIAIQFVHQYLAKV